MGDIILDLRTLKKIIKYMYSQGSWQIIKFRVESKGGSIIKRLQRFNSKKTKDLS